MKKFISISIVLFHFLFLLNAQNEVWPVQVTGFMIPPYSLDLKVYGTDRINDLNFQIVLRDPKETTLKVTPVLSIEQNGTVIYRTDMNQIFNPIVLNQFQSYTLDGAALNKYLSNDALTTQTFSGRGSTEVPEGFTQICLQMYGLDRVVPVSNKFCISGNFRLNQPPQLIKPAFNEKIKMPPVQNMIFSWMPMHLSSGNNPGPVEYLFEMVELPSGYMNANDVFETALRIYSTNVMTNSLIYTPAEPILNPNTYYAWRVTASSIMHPTSKLFQNDGKSEISIFLMYDGDAPTTELNPFDKPSPRGCSVYETSYGPVEKADNQSNLIGANQIVKLGYFEMKIKEVSGDLEQGFSGKGVIPFPMLRSTLEVEFKNIKVNKEGRVYESELIESRNEKFSLTSEALNEKNIAQNITRAYAFDLYSAIDDSKKVMQLPENSLKLNKLPLALTNSKVPSSLVGVIGIRFTPQNAYLNLVGLDAEGISQTNSIDQSLINVSAATAVQASPYGLISSAYLVPIHSGVGNALVSALPSIIESYGNNEKNKLPCNCNGVYEKKLSKNYAISEDILVQNSNNLPVPLDLKDVNQPIELYNGLIGSTKDISIPGINNLILSTDGGILNLNQKQQINFPDDFKPINSGDDSRGVWLQGVKAKLPKQYNLLKEEELTLDKGNLFIDAEKIKLAKIYSENIVKLQDGKVEDWRYSVDKYTLSIEDGNIVGPSVFGQIKLPVSNDLIKYSGELLPSGSSTLKIKISMPESEINIPMWAAKLKLTDATTIGMDIKNLNNEKLVYPSGNLSGNLDVKVSNELLREKIKGNVGQTLSDIKLALGLKTDDFSFSLDNLDLQNWNVSPYINPEEKYKATSVGSLKANFVIGGKTFDVTQSEIIKKVENNVELLGLSTVIKEGNNKINIILWGSQNNGEFVLDQIEAKIIQIKCNCAVKPEGVGMLELDKYYDKLIDEEYRILEAQTNEYSGSKLSTDLKTDKKKYFHTVRKAELMLNTTPGGWIVKDGYVSIPFLGIEIEINQTGNKLESKRSLSVMKFDKPGDSYYTSNKKVQLPIIVNTELFTRLGFHKIYNIPQNARLIISDLVIPDIDKPEGSLTFSMAVDVNPKTIFKGYFGGIPTILTFQSKPITISNSPANAIQLKDVELSLMSDHKGEDYGFMKQGKVNGDTKTSKALINCGDGFKFFDMVGYYTPKDLVPKSVGNLNMMFTLNTSLNGNKHDLTDFIAVIQDKNTDDQKWDFYMPDAPHLIFSAGEKYVIYLDHSKTLKVPGNPNPKSYGETIHNESFQGIVFEKFRASISGFNNDSKAPLHVELKDGFYFQGDGDKKGFYIEAEVTDPIKEDQGANFSGWKYTINSLNFKVERSILTENVTCKGEMLIPIFSKVPKNHEKRVFDSGWVEYTSETKYEHDKISATVSFESIYDKLFQSILLPGMGIKLDTSSFLNLIYNETSKKWEVKGNFSGLCDFYLNHNVILSLNIAAPPGLEIQTAAITFQNLIVSSVGFDGAIKFKAEGDSLVYLDLGKWGETDSKGLAEIDKIQDFQTRLNYIEKIDFRGKPSKALAKPITQTRQRSNALAKNDSRLPPPTRQRSDALGKNDSRLPGPLPQPQTRQRSDALGTNDSRLPASQKNASTTAKKTSAPITAFFMGFDAQTTYLGPEKRGENEIVMGFRLDVGLMGATKQKTADGKGEMKSQFIRTTGVLNMVYRPTKTTGDIWEFSSIDLKCLSVEGAIGPVGFKGGLNIIEGNAEYGSGLKGVLAGEIEGLGGLNMVGQFGKKKDNNGEYYYGFLDLEAFSEQGIPLFYDPITNVPKVDFFGAGGGFQLNMMTKRAIDSTKMMSTKEEIDQKVADTKAAEARKENDDFCSKVMGGLLNPGTGLDQDYTPMKGSFGGKIYAIFGPWSPVKPPYTMVADAGIQLQIQWNETTNELSLGEMTIYGRGYLLPVSIMQRRDNNVGDLYAGATLNWRNKYLEAELSFRSRFQVPYINKTLFSMPEKYDATVFSSRLNYNTGRLKLSFDPSNPYAELKLGGPGTGTLQPLSGTLLTLPNADGYSTIKAYAQIGANVDAPLPLEKLIPELKNFLKESVLADRKQALQEDLLKESPEAKVVDLNAHYKATGIAFGLTLEQTHHGNYLLMHDDFKIKLGFDVNLRQYEDVTCTNSSGKGQIGLKGWYAMGKGFAYANGDIRMGFRFFGKDLTLSLFTLTGYLAMEIKGPNPTYFMGMVGGKYSVLGGAYSDKFNYRVVIGEECEAAEEKPNPIADVKIYKNASVSAGATDVDRYSDIKLYTNFQLNQDFPVTQYKSLKDSAAGYTVNFMASIKNIFVKKEGIAIDPKSYTYVISKTGIDENKSINISFSDVLDPLTIYTIEYEFGWKSKAGSESNVQYKDAPDYEKGSLSFKTGSRPTTITDGMIEYSAPGVKQRYWHKGYADTEIKFSRKAQQDASFLFPEFCKTCGAIPSAPGGVKYKYIARLTEYPDPTIHEFPITIDPEQGVEAEILSPMTHQVDGGKYEITYLEKRKVYVDRVTFQGLKSYDIKKGKVCKLEILRLIDIVLPQVNDLSYTKIKTMVDENTLTLKEYFFGTSNYDNLSDKLKKVQITHIKSAKKLRDFSHPSDLYDPDRAAAISDLKESKFHSVSDDFYGCNIIGDNFLEEKFDYYDIMRIRRNIQIEYQDDYFPDIRVKQYHGEKAMNSTLEENINRADIVAKGYLKKVLKRYDKSDENDFGSTDKISDGTKWHYRIISSLDEGKNKLTDNEIANKKLYKVERTKFRDVLPYLQKDQDADFLLQDMRSRIVINQLYWLSKMRLKHGDWITNTDDDGKYDGIGYKGEFKNEKGERDFSYILTPPPGRSGSEYAYIATEPGYRLSYHGRSRLLWPNGEWAEMVESQRDKGKSMEKYSDFKPERTPGSEIEVDNATELSTEEWYKIKEKDESYSHSGKIVEIPGREIIASHGGGFKYNLWGLEKGLYSDGESSSTYGLNSPAFGLIHNNGSTPIEELPQNKAVLWNFSNEGKNFTIKNYTYSDNNFPAVLCRKNNITPKFPGNDNTIDIKVTLKEANVTLFNGECKYRITSKGKVLQDNFFDEEWRIYRVGRFYKIVSTYGMLLKGEHNDPAGFGDYMQAQVEDEKKFKNARTSQTEKREYYKRVWNITPDGEGGYVIQNAAYDNRHLSLRDNNIIYQPGSSENDHLFTGKPDIFTIEEIK